MKKTEPSPMAMALGKKLIKEAARATRGADQKPLFGAPGESARVTAGRMLAIHGDDAIEHVEAAMAQALRNYGTFDRWGTAYNVPGDHWLRVSQLVRAATGLTQPDLLWSIFERQYMLQHRMAEMGKAPEPLQVKWDEDGAPVFPADILLVMKQVQQFAEAIQMEAAELKDWTPWKHWSTRSGNKEVAAEDVGTAGHIHEMRVEGVDILCFLTTAMMWMGMDPTDVEEAHAAKSSVSHERQDTGKY